MCLPCPHFPLAMECHKWDRTEKFQITAQGRAALLGLNTGTTGTPETGAALGVTAWLQAQAPSPAPNSDS